ncbi:MAG: serine hydrolase domain-containing protein [Pyrinomonadaceae bacterium]
MRTDFKLFLLFGLLALISIAQTAKKPTADSPFNAAAAYSSKFRGLSVLVMKGDKVVFEEYQNGHSSETPWMLASGTKSFSGAMLAAAIEDKIISGFDEKVSETITEWKSDPRRSGITIRQLLSLTSGIDAGSIGRPPSYSEAITFSSKFEPGEKFEYGPAPFQIFGELMRRKLAPKKESVLDYLKHRILDKIGLRVANWTLQNGQPNLPSGAFLTAREWAKFGTLLKNGGKWHGKQILDKKLLDQLYTGSKANPNYGVTFWLNRSNNGKAEISETKGPLQRLLGDNESETTAISKNGVGSDIAKDLFMAAGAGKQRLYVIPSLDLVVVRQGRQSKFDDHEFLKLITAAK